jgi:hypothetical protein
VQLESASLFPVITKSSFSEHDFSTEIGFLTQISQIKLGLRVATFDELEVYNLNNPFVESVFFLPTESEKDCWSLTMRYQLTLGFGRLDRILVGLNYLKDW